MYSDLFNLTKEISIVLWFNLYPIPKEKPLIESSTLLSYATAVAYDNNVDDSINGFSLGIGYKLNQSTIDISFVKLNKSEYKRLYDTGLTNQVHLNTDNTMLTISISTIF